MDFIKSVNWVDLLMLAIVIRIIYIAINTGFVVELFKLLGLLITLFVCFHYYFVLGGLVKQTIVSQQIFFAAAFVLLWIVMAVICKFARQGLLTLFSVETLSVVDKWGAVILGALRFLVVGSMVMFILISTNVKYMQIKTIRSFSHKYILGIAPGIYGVASDGIVARIFPDEHGNPVVRETMRSLAK